MHNQDCNHIPGKTEQKKFKQTNKKKSSKKTGTTPLESVANNFFTDSAQYIIDIELVYYYYWC